MTAIEGAVSFRAAADTEWGYASPNQPATTGDRVWSDSNGRAEIEVGNATVRVWHQTEVDVVRLDDHTVQLAVPQGSAALRLSALTAGSLAEIDAPNAVVTPTATGEYRVDVSSDGATTTVTVWSGTADITAGGSSFTLQGHQVATIRGDSSSTPTYDVSQSHAPDEFDQWSTDLDNRMNSQVAQRQYVPSGMPGWEDLDDNGSWDYDNNAGPVWYPSGVAADWVPYRFGHWVWFGAWGWTWVDDAPWGWAPFHYGRWAWFNNRWGWCPGRVIAQPVFAPALVVFVGGATWAPGGGYGWFPLGPGEVYRPPYVVSTPYLRRVNITTVTNITTITNVTNVTNINYRNREVANAVTVVSRNTFETAGPVGRALVHVPQNEVIRGPITTGVAIAPTRASVVVRPEGRAIVVPPRSVSERTVVALHSPPPPRVQLSEQLRTISSNNGRPLTSQQMASLRATSPTVRARSVVSVARPTAPHLTAARPGLPETHPALETGAVGRPIAMPPNRPAAVPPATGVRTEPAAPAGPPPPVARPTERVGSPSLAASYAAERDQQETRHVQEFAKPPAGESQAALAARQQTEDQALESRYHQAATAGRPAMPPRPSAPPPRPAGGGGGGGRRK